MVTTSPPNTGSLLFPKKYRSPPWLILPNYPGASSAIIRSSNRRSGSGILKDVDGEDFIITRHCASRRTGSSSPNGRRFPPQDLVPPLCSRHLPHPGVTDPDNPPLRPERHIPNSIATMHRRLIIAIVKGLPRCPCGAARKLRYSRRLNTFMTQ